MSFLRPSKNIRILLTGGGSGGHTFPIIAVYRQLKQIEKGQHLPLELMYLGPKDFTNEFIIKEGLMVKNILSGKLRRSFNPKDWLLNIKDLFKLLIGFFQALFELWRFMPDIIFSKGGYGSVPVMLAALIYAVPTTLHESDSIPGLSNTIFGKLAKKVFVAFKRTTKWFPAQRTIVVGNPIREDLLKDMNSQQAKNILGLSEKPTLVVLGGSQGAKTLNDLLLDVLPKLLEKVEIIHQTGVNNFQEVKQETKIIANEILEDKDLIKYYHPVPFFYEDATDPYQSLKIILWAADLIVSRAGSGAIFEIAALGKPAILIPLAWASRDHQTQNAYEFNEAGGGLVLESANLTPNIFSQVILDLISDPERLKIMGEKSLTFSKPDAALIIAQEIINLCGLKKNNV